MIYGSFAEVYDLFMKDVPYDDWTDVIVALWQRHGLNKPELVLDLACGTGSITTRLASRGCDMIGVDISSEMLGVARQKNKDIFYLQQDMRELELYGTVDAAVCMCDGINYLTEADDLNKVFALLNNYLNPDGLLIFDINTPYKYCELLADNVFAEAQDNAAYIWDNYFYEDEGINEYTVNFFVQHENCHGLYRRFSETHYQRAWTVEEINAALFGAGLTLLETVAIEGTTPVTPQPDSDRLFFIARK